jgi:hypothetical protein
MPEPQDLSGEFEELAEFKAYLDEREKRPVKERRRPERPIVTEVGPGPEAPKGPFCHLCRDHRRLLRDVLKLPDGTKVPLCRTCQKQVLWDKAHRCISCGDHALTKLLNSGGVCKPCERSGVEAQQNLYDLIKLKWLGVIRGD